MKRKGLLMVGMVLCLTLSGCANRETQQTASVSSTGGEQVSSSLPSSQSQSQEPEPEQQTQEPEQTPLPTAESADGSKEAGLGAEVSASSLTALEENGVAEQESTQSTETTESLLVSLEEKEADVEAVSDFIKIEVGVDDVDYGVFALDANGHLYFGRDSSMIELIDTEVKDFSYSGSSFYILKENGDLLYADSYVYRVGQPLTLFYHNDNGEKIYDSIMVLSDGSVLNYQLETEEWGIMDITAKKIDAEHWGAAIIDGDDTLWYLDRSTGTLQKIADGVIDCCYKDRNKVYYSSDIWYITSDHKLHIYQTEPQTGTISDFPVDAVAVVGEMGRYLVQQEDGTLVLGQLSASTVDMGITGYPADFFGGRYAFIDEDGKIHFGEVQLDQLTVMNEQVIAHP